MYIYIYRRLRKRKTGVYILYTYTAKYALLLGFEECLRHIYINIDIIYINKNI